MLDSFGYMQMLIRYKEVKERPYLKMMDYLLTILNY